ncbi:LAFE_0G02476g1_1 [Lachancea fermentati]|uniref:LAFE_0G02476g1_1 n=1 Tax=Lachancea fermentati TaxID=4955 RepID=A0A1G4MGX2_LACFM|nr:LAFE_0G02476g1_1 [Lachancea fermentati]
MGLFSRKPSESQKLSDGKNLIVCNKIIRSPPEKYGKAPALEKLSRDQWEAYRQVLNHFRDPALLLPSISRGGYKADTTKSHEERCLSSWEKFWLSRECLIRYLRANDWEVNEAITKLVNTLVWRREFGITYDNFGSHELEPEDIEEENATGKLLILGYDRHRRPLLYMKNGRQNTKTSFKQVQLLVYMVESTITMMPQGVETMTVLVDYKQYKEPGIITPSMPPISIGKQILHIVQNHYPECLGKALLANIPWFAWTFLKLLHPLIDAKTREKLEFEGSFATHVEPTQLEAVYNGRLNFHYNHEVYWPDLIKVVRERRQMMYERFLKFGGSVGLSEYDFKGSDDTIHYPVDYSYGYTDST